MLNERLLHALEQATGLKDASALHFVQCSSSLTTGAIILHGFAAREEFARVVLKTARNPQSPHSLQGEWQSLAQVRRDAALAALTPEGLATFDVDDARFFAYSGVRGRTMFAAFRNRLLSRRVTLLKRFAARALEVSLLMHRLASQSAPATVAADDLIADLDWLRRTAPL